MRRALIVLLCVAALGFAGLFFVFRKSTEPSPDAAALNDTVVTVMQTDDSAEATRILTENMTLAFGDMDASRNARDERTFVYLCALLAAFTVAGICVIIYCERRVLLPFRKLRRFAKDVAAGDLDIPLEMDRHGSFGAFTEAFDILREELKSARENERKANLSKKELVASLSHDIKTPVASIKAVAELMLAKSPGGGAQLEVIMAKADQINLLITDMFHATLEELEQLRVTPTELPSTTLYELIQNADYGHRVQPFTVPECIVTADKTRLQQVLDNIISNSYKYADTDISVDVVFDGGGLAVWIADAGPGVSQDELPLVFGKFFRGGNASGKSGSGLGLYIAKHLMDKMGGGISCEQTQGGFCVKIFLAM